MKESKTEPDLYKDITGIMMMKAFKCVCEFASYHMDKVTIDVFTQKILEIRNSFRRYCIDNIYKYDVYTDQLEPITDVEFKANGMVFSTKPCQFGYGDYYKSKEHDPYKDAGQGFTDDSREILVNMIQSKNEDMVQTGYYLLYKAFTGGSLMGWVMRDAVRILSEIYNFDSYLTLSYTMNYWFDEIVNRPYSFLSADTLTLIHPTDVHVKEQGTDPYLIVGIKPTIVAYPNGYVHMYKAEIKVLGHENE